ncbi:hypothetical protein [Lentzea sp. CA-135723]|uniref:hypothetical protein n=1 Tax=Lentzea sp. CA-135723 TaxID=3239950 RepID=UPI003D89B9ED
MTLLTRRREHRRGEDREMIGHTIGNALVVHPRHALRNEIRDLALGLAADPEHELVVVDLPPDSSMAVWEAAAKLLPRKRRGLRLVISGRPRETTALAGQWLSERLGRTVIAPDGAVLPGADGTLFVDSGWGTGWRRFQPGRTPELDGKRFPRPSWDEVSSLVEVMPTSAGAVAEPVPGGAWLRPRGPESVLGPHRGRLVETLPCQPDVCVVVLGCPGATAVTMHDVARFWSWLPDPLREKVRMVAYGPIATPGPYGQSVADALGTEVTCYTGLPVGARHDPDVYALRTDGALGWRAFAEEVSYVPARPGEPAPPPALVAYREPFYGVDEVEPAVYRYSAHAVLEVVQSGLWLRPPHEVGHAAAVRATEPDASRHLVLFDDDEHLRDLADDVFGRLDPMTRALSEVVRADSLVRHRVQAGRALGSVETARGTAEAAPGRPSADALADTVVMRPVATVAGPMAVAGLGTVAGPASVAGAGESAALAPLESDPLESDPLGFDPLEFDGVIGGTAPHEVPVAPPSLIATVAPADPFAAEAPVVPSDPFATPAAEPVTRQRSATSSTTEAPTPPASHTATSAPPTPAPLTSAGPGSAPSGWASLTSAGPTPAPPTTSLSATPSTSEAAAPPTPPPPTPAPPTPAPPTPAPPTPAPPTPAPPTPAPPTPAPPTPAPPASAPLTSVSPTPAPPTSAPPTSALPTSVSPTPTPPTPARPTSAPPTSAPPAAAPPTPAPPSTSVQPTPESAAAALLPTRGIDEERSWLRRALSREYTSVANSVSRVLSESPSFQGALDRSSGGVLTDAAAIRLYLSGQGDGLDLSLRSGRVGPHVPFARCVVSGLSRLPSHRGAAVFSASPTDREWELYRARRYFTEWGFVHALTTPCAAQRKENETDVLLWSMTARRTRLLEPEEHGVADRVLFVPGTSFKVLDLSPPGQGRRGLVLVRELAAGEIDESGRVDGNRASLDELAVNTLRRSLETWASGEVRVPAAAASRFGTLPGLVRTPEEER